MSSKQAIGIDVGGTTINVSQSCTAPAITQQPQSQSVVPGESAKLTVAALPSHNHFSILEELASPTGKLTALVAHLCAD